MVQQSLNISGVALALGSDNPVFGLFIRRDQDTQREWVLTKSQKVAEMIGHAGAVYEGSECGLFAYWGNAGLVWVSGVGLK
jgi:hypothetical protein